MNILIVGSGGREQALVWKIQQSPRVQAVYLCTAQDSATVLDEVRAHHVDIVIIGGETALAAGLSDELKNAGIAVFGPSKAAAEIESSKAFAKDFMQQHDIPTAKYAVFQEYEKALDYLQKTDYPIVIKASGLAAGKGVFLPENKTDAENILKKLLIENQLGVAGRQIVIEERLTGPEVSLLAFSDGKTVQVMPTVRDYKRLKNNNLGPNTGGMGAYAPVPEITQAQINKFAEIVLQPAIDGLREAGKAFIGVLYAGLILTADGPKVLEFNCRFGDPETQVLMPLLQTDLVEIIEACISGNLEDCTIKWNDASAVCIVMASRDYPLKSSPSEKIYGLEFEQSNSIVFQAGVQEKNGEYFTSGGRVLNITAWGNSLEVARTRANDRVAMIYFNGMQYRTDIAQATAVEEIDHYAKAGVDITAGNKAVSLMGDAVRATYGEEVLAGIGAFGGMFDAKLCQTMSAPVLVASTDGIGTKVELAAQYHKLDGLGADIVNHSVNDILVQGARPLFFLDYIASDKLNPEQTANIVTSMANACREVNCALLGGETAEMPGIYMSNRFDVAGTIVGIVEKSEALPRRDLHSGDLLLGLVSSGPHTNGYSLIRKILSSIDKRHVTKKIIDQLLVPHRCYLSLIQPLLNHPEKPIKALVHITGGGFIENIPRVLPKNLSAEINLDSWKVPELFQFIQTQGKVPFLQMYRVFNMGIGMIMIIDPRHHELITNFIHEKCYLIGRLIDGNHDVQLR